MEEVEQQHSIPVVDLSNPDEEFVMREVMKASEEWGVFQVVNHEIPADLIQRLQKVGKQFFELSDEEKQSVANPKDSVEIQGYEKRDLRYVKSFVDHLIHIISPPSDINYRYWPTNPPEYREVNEEYTNQLKKLSEKILEWLSMGLGLHREALKEGLGGELIRYMLRINYYPPCLPSESTIGLPEHTDFGGLALLVPNDVPGLQVFKSPPPSSS